MKNTVSTPNPVMVSAGRKSWVTRRINKLQAEYNAATTSGRKSWIKKQINATAASK